MVNWIYNHPYLTIAIGGLIGVGIGLALPI